MKQKYTPLVLSALLLSGVPVLLADQPIKVQAADYKYDKYQTDLLAQLNFERKMVGLNPVSLHPLLVKSAENHSNYLKLNGYAYAHDEVKGDKGFTGREYEDRLKAVGINVSDYGGGFETISGSGESYTTQMRLLIQTAPYHRVALLTPSTQYVGFGYTKGGAVVTNALDSVNESNDMVTYYPYNNQTNLETTYYGNEDPDPLQGTGLEKSGTILTFTPSNYYYAGTEKATLTNSRGEKVPVLVESGGIGPLLIIPKSPLEYNTRYTASISVVDEDTGRKASKTWSFTTKEDPDVLKRANMYKDYNKSEYWAQGLLWAVEKKYLASQSVKNTKTGKTELYLKPSTKLTEGDLVTALTKYYYSSEYSKTKPADKNWKHSVGYQVAKKHKLPTMATMDNRKKATVLVTKGDMLRVLAAAHLRKPVSEQVAFDTLKGLGVVKDRSLTAYGPKSAASRAHIATYLYRYMSSK
ncbi:CAP domain-containing protein [Exiguobacterium sp. S22-S28]|uniref:CAP domain-containing protein n=1 Tax=Exiguobacterium sp. S22-S28 TaxID=3342768 RepID=UPI00372D1268